MTTRQFLAVAMPAREDKGMPSWAGFLSEEEMTSIYRYVKGRSLGLVPVGRPPSENEYAFRRTIRSEGGSEMSRMRRLWLWVIALSVPVALVSPLVSPPVVGQQPGGHSTRCPRTLTNG